MENELPYADFDKPRYLLPDGCKDLADWLRLQQLAAAKAPQPTLKRPSQISISEPVQVRDLAALLHVKAYRVITALIRLKVFVSADSLLSLPTAAAVGASFGVSVIKAGPSGPAN